LNHLAFTALCEYLRLNIVEDIVLCVSCKLFGSESFHFTMFQMLMADVSWKRWWSVLYQSLQSSETQWLATTVVPLSTNKQQEIAFK